MVFHRGMTSVSVPDRWRSTDRAARLRDAGLALVIATASAAWIWHRLGFPARGTAWAEDSGRFLEQRIASGPIRTLWHPYDGYLHLVPRVLVDVAVAIRPVHDYATVVNALSCTVIGLVCGAVFLLAGPVVRAWPLRVLLAVVPVISPIGIVEIAGNTANLHWYLLFLAPWLFAARPRSWWSAAVLAATALAVTLTEIQTAVFLPLFLLARRERRALPVLGAALLGIAAQVVATVTHPRPPATSITSPSDIVLGYLTQAFAGGWTPRVQRVGMAVLDHGWWVLVVPAVAVLAALAVAARVGGPQRRWMSVALVGGSVVVWTAAFALNHVDDSDWSAFTRQQYAGTGPYRYAAAASMLLVAAVVLAADALLARGRWWAVPAWLLVASVVAAGVLGAHTVERRDAGPVWATQVEHAVPGCRADPTRSVQISAAPIRPTWRADVPCSWILPSAGPVR